MCDLKGLRRRLNYFPRLNFSLLPTPCHRLGFVSKKYEAEVYCKRDDLSGLAMGGNKTRKLEFLLAEAREGGCDTLVACGGIQSNFCRLAASAASVAGMEIHLILGGGIPKEARGNLFLDQLLGAKIHYVETPEWEAWELEAQNLAEDLKSKGKKVFFMPVGGSVPTGILGYVEAFVEIMEDCERLGIEFDHIVHATGSGGTQAGLVVGKELSGWSGQILGISVAMKKGELEPHVLELASATAGLLGGKVSKGAVKVDDRYIGEGYAIPTEEGNRALELMATREGIILDRVYTGKAMAGLLDYLEQGLLTGGKILFIHTGGQPELFA